MSHAEVFERVYASGEWGPGSGSGSIPEFAAPYCRFIERYLRRHGIGSVLDLGCGDGQLARAIGWGPASYTGIDVVTHIHNGSCSSDRCSNGGPGRRVIDGDFRTCPWPPADLVLIKDVLQHWPAADIEALRPRLEHYRGHGAHILITNQAAGARLNSDIEVGKVRPIDLSQPPFCWPVREVLRWLGDEVKSTVELAG